MSQRLTLYAAVGILVAGCLVACAEITALGMKDAKLAATPTVSPAMLTSPVAARSVAFTVQDSTPTPPPATPSGPAVIRVWWPDDLYPHAGSIAEDLFNGQIANFEVTYSAFTLDVRRKRSNGLGGILPTLRTASPVAPGAMPDLTLMRRADMVTAMQEGLIVPLDDWISPDLVGDNLLPGVRAMGEVDGVLYGLPYVVNVVHSIYRGSVFADPMATWDDVLAQKPIYFFPAGKAQGAMISWTPLLQYLAAGGRLADDAGNPALDHDVLLEMLDYYEQGRDEGIFSPNLVELSQFESYWTNFASGEANLITVDTVTYLGHKDSVQNLGLSPIPTVDGTPITALDGWMWVLTTHDPDHQDQARAFLSWMMRVSQQSMFTEALGILPSQQRALRLWDDETYADFARQMIDSALLIANTQRSSTSALALADSVIDVLGGVSAEAATDSAISKLAAQE